MIRGYLALLVASGNILERVEVPHALWEELSGVYITGLGQLGLLLTLLLMEEILHHLKSLKS